MCCSKRNLLDHHILQAISGECGDSYDGTDRIRHAETPELAREALIDSVVLIFKSQVEVAFREQVTEAGQHSPHTSCPTHVGCSVLAGRISSACGSDSLV